MEERAVSCLCTRCKLQEECCAGHCSEAPPASRSAQSWECHRTECAEGLLEQSDRKYELLREILEQETSKEMTVEQ